MNEENYVEVIEEGRIVRVSEVYARLEGLTILRRNGDFKWNDSNYYKKQPNSVIGIDKKPEIKQRKGINLEPFRKPLRYAENDIASSLIDNFHWKLLEKRRQRELTRKQLAESLNEQENSIKSIENGIVPSENYILINKLERYFGITLRKDGNDFSNSMAEVMKKANERDDLKEKRSFVKEEGDDLPELKDLLEDSEEKPL